MGAEILKIITYYSRVSFAYKNRKKILAIISSLVIFIFSIIFLGSIIVNFPVLLMQEALPDSQKTDDIRLFAKEDVEKTEKEKKGIITYLLSLISKDGESAEFIGKEPSKEEIIMVYTVKYDENFDEKELNKEKVKYITKKFLKREGLKLIALPFEEAVELCELTEEEKVIALNMYNASMYDQLQESAGAINKKAYIDYGNIVYKDEVTNVHYYNQRDIRWGNKLYKDTTIGETACGPTCIAMAVKTFTNQDVDPFKVATWAGNNGYKLEGGGSFWKLIPDAAKHYGLNVKGNVESANELVDALSSGKMVIAIMGKGHFTKTGHFIVLRGITKEGKVLVADPYTKENNERQWDMNIILNEVKGGRTAGGPFWIISK